MTNRGRGRSRSAAPAAVPIAIPGRAVGVPQDPFVDPLVPFLAPQGVMFFPVPLGPSMAPQFLDASECTEQQQGVCPDQFLDASECTEQQQQQQQQQQGADEDGDGRESPASSISSSGYGSCPSNDSSVWAHRTAVEADHWRERVVFASSAYPSMGIEPTFNFWSPISEDEPLFEDLARLPAATPRHSHSTWPSSPAKESDCESDMDMLTREIFGSSAEVRQEHDESAVAAASRYPGRGSGAVFPDGDPTLQNANAHYMPEDNERAMIVRASNLLHWGQFSGWAPMPTDAEAVLLAAVAERQQEEMRRIAAIKKMQKIMKYRKCRKL